MFKNRIFLTSGVTLIELLVSIALASVVFMIVGSVLATFVTQNTRSQRQENFEQAKNDLTQELSNNIRWGTEITLSDSILTIDSNEYRVENGYFLKNGQNLITDNIAVRNFEIADRSTDPERLGADITIDLEDRNYPLAHDVMHLVVSQRVTEIDF